jgi:hypothetical protein
MSIVTRKADVRETGYEPRAYEPTRLFDSIDIMPFAFLRHVLTTYKLDYWELLKGPLAKYGIGIGLLYALRTWCAGGVNQDGRHMASRVVIITVRAQLSKADK